MEPLRGGSAPSNLPFW